MKIAFGCDHAIGDKREAILKTITDLGHKIIDCGTKTLESVNYPCYGYKVGTIVGKKEADFGIVICGTGIGIGISANKVKNVRCVLANKIELAVLGRKKFNANVLAMGMRLTPESTMEEIIRAFLKTEFQEINGLRAKIIDSIGKDNFDMDLSKEC